MGEILARRAHILIVEDNPADAMLISKSLKERSPGIELFVAQDGYVASNYLFRRGEFKSAPTPDFVILDLNLPGRDGREVLKEIKADTRLKSLPVLVFTSSEAAHDIQSSYDGHANAYFSKPPDLDEFYGVMDAIYQHWINVAKLPSCVRNSL